jgi:hypothetical protein
VKDAIIPGSFRGAWLTMWTVYDNPTDYPGKVVVRRWRAVGDEPTPDPEPCYVGDDLSAARQSIPPEANYCLIRSPDDDPAIMETWL